MIRERPRLTFVVLLVTLALSAASCFGGPSTLGGQLKAWASSSGYSADVAQINADLTGLANGYKERKLLALRTACEGFSTDASQLYTQLPMPDHQLTNEIGTALSDFFTASVDCYAASSFKSKRFEQYQHLMSTARALYSRAVTQLGALGVH